MQLKLLLHIFAVFIYIQCLLTKSEEVAVGMNNYSNVTCFQFCIGTSFLSVSTMFIFSRNFNENRKSVVQLLPVYVVYIITWV